MMIVVYILAVIAALGLIGAAISVRVVQQFERGVVFRFGQVRDATRGPGLAVIAPIVAMSVVMGVLPNVFLRPMAPSVERTLTQVRRGTQIRVDASPTRPQRTVLPRPVAASSGVAR